MSANDSWKWQGRQQHQWFGHGTKPTSIDDGNNPGFVLNSLNERIRQLGITALAGLPPGKRNHPSATFTGVRQVHLQNAMQRWVQARHLSRHEFAAKMFGADPADPGVREFHDSALSLGEAARWAHLRDATDEFAAGMLGVGLDYFPRFLADAATKAGRANTEPTIQVRYVRGNITTSAQLPGGQWQELKSDGAVRAGELPVLSQGREQYLVKPRPDLNPPIQEAALRCDGARSGGCSNGGSYGTSGMFRLFGRNLCRSCAVKDLGIEDLPGKEQIEALEPYSR